jgi:hypothetical protein
MMRYALSSHHPPAAEDETAECETEPEGAHREGADGDHLAPDGKPLPVTERRCFLVGQFLAAPLLAQGTAGLEPEVEVVEDLRGLFRHAPSV